MIHSQDDLYLTYIMTLVIFYILHGFVTRICPFLTHGSSEGRFVSQCHHVCRNCSSGLLPWRTNMQFEQCVHAHWILEKTNMPNETNDVFTAKFSLRHATKCHTCHFSSPRLELFHLAHSRYFVKLEPTRGAYDPMDSRLLRSTSDMSKLSQRQ